VIATGLAHTTTSAEDAPGRRRAGPIHKAKMTRKAPRKVAEIRGGQPRPRMIASTNRGTTSVGRGSGSHPRQDPDDGGRGHKSTGNSTPLRRTGKSGSGPHRVRLGGGPRDPGGFRFSGLPLLATTWGLPFGYGTPRQAQAGAWRCLRCPGMSGLPLVRRTRRLESGAKKLVGC